MFKRFGFLAALMLLLVAAFPAFAQEVTPEPSASSAGASWALTLYDQASGTVRRVGPKSEDLGQFTLPIQEGFDSYDYNLADFASKNLLAYLVSQVGDGSNPVQPTKLVIFNASAQFIPGSFDLNPAITREGINAAGNSLSFSADGTRLIVGYYYPVDQQNTQTMELDVLDATSGQVVNKLDSNALANVGVVAATPYYTTVLSFNGDTAVVMLHPVPNGQGLQTVVFNWNITTNAVTAAAPELVNAADYFPATDDAILLTFNQSLGTQTPGETPTPGMVTPANTVQLFNLGTGAAQKIYDEDTHFTGAKFVQNGARILAFADEGARAVLLGRDGTKLAEFMHLPGAAMVYGVPEGFVYADPQQPGNFVLMTTSDDSFMPTTFYTAQAPYTSYSVENYDTSLFSP